jgi:hypothetical protein
VLGDRASVDRAGAFFVRRLYATGELSMRACAEAMTPSEGITSKFNAAWNLEQAIGLLGAHGDTVQPPVILPVSMDPMQLAIFTEWLHTRGSEWECGTGEGEYALLDAIKWKFGEGWRRRYPDDIPPFGRTLRR